MSCVFLPAVPGVVIKTFTTESAGKFIKSAGQQEDVKCFMFFNSEEMPSIGMSDWHAALMDRKHYHIAFFGGTANKLTICKESHNRRACGVPTEMVGWSISGENVSAWSVAIDILTVSNEQVEETLTDFKAEVDLRKYSVGFMSSPEDLENNFFGEKIVESGIFRKLFPGVPLVKTFGMCQFGRTSVPIIGIRNVLLQYGLAIIFMILSYG